jgi:hypothetical protein
MTMALWDVAFLSFGGWLYDKLDVYFRGEPHRFRTAEPHHWRTTTSLGVSDPRIAMSIDGTVSPIPFLVSPTIGFQVVNSMTNIMLCMVPSGNHW